MLNTSHCRPAHTRITFSTTESTVRNRTHILALPHHTEVGSVMSDTAQPPPRDRAKRYRELATDAKRAAATAQTEEMREA